MRGTTKGEGEGREPHSAVTETSTEPLKRQAPLLGLDALGFLSCRTPAFQSPSQLHCRSPREEPVDYTRVTAKAKAHRGKGTPQLALPADNLCMIPAVKRVPLVLHH